MLDDGLSTDPPPDSRALRSCYSRENAVAMKIPLRNLRISRVLSPCSFSTIAFILCGCISNRTENEEILSRLASLANQTTSISRELALVSRRIDVLGGGTAGQAKPPPIRTVLTRQPWRWGSLQTHIVSFTADGGMVNETDGIVGTWSSSDDRIAVFSSAGHTATMRWLDDLALLLVDQVNPDGTQTYFIAAPAKAANPVGLHHENGS